MGWLLDRIMAKTPPDVLSDKQLRAIERIIQKVGIVEYRKLKDRAGVPSDVSIRRLSKSEAWRIISLAYGDQGAGDD